MSGPWSINPSSPSASFWTELPEACQKELVKLGVRERFPPQHVLFLEGEKACSIYLILSGHVHLKKESCNGDELVIGWKTAGQLIGDVFLYNGHQPYNVTAITHTETEVLTFKRHHFEKVLRKHSFLCQLYQKWLMKEIQIHYTKLRDLCLYGKRGALYSILVRLANMYGTPTEQGIRIEMRLTHLDLARLIGGSRENVSRMLHQLIDDGIISVQQKKITILNLAYLKKYLQCGDCPPELCVI